MINHQLHDSTTQNKKKKSTYNTYSTSPKTSIRHPTSFRQQKNNYKKLHQTRSTVIQSETDRELPNTSSSPQTNEQPRDQWGHELGSKNPNTIWLLLQNVGGIDLHPRGSVKLAALQEFMTNTQVDIAALTECNSAWQHVDPKLWPQQQTKFWWENAHWSLTHNRQDPNAAAYQPGGTGIVVVNQLSYRAQRPGDDSVGLGRWCWARLRGKHNQYLRVVSMYRPCKASGPLSTYQQQVRFWSSKRVETCPRDKLLTDLRHEIVKWQEEGDFIVLLADMNDDVLSKDIQNFCQELQLVEAISSLHGRSPIPTHQRGSKAIDGIYVSQALLAHAEGGILPLGIVTASDHRAIWLDIRAEHIEMHHQDSVQRPACRRLKCHDPRIVQRYLFVLSRELEQLHAEERTMELFTAAANGAWTTAHEEEFNNLDQEIITAKLKAESLCRKIRAGNTPWTPELTQAIQRILYWKGIITRRSGGAISTTVLKRRAGKGQLSFKEEHWKLPAEALKKKVDAAYDDYFQIKAQTDKRDTWLGQLIAAQALAKNTTKQKLWKQLRQREQARQKARQVKQALGRTGPISGLIQVEAPDPNNLNKRITAFTKETLEQACLAEAQRRFTQAAHTPVLQLPSEQQLDSLHIGSPAFHQILDGTYPYHQLQDPYTVKLFKQLKRPPSMPEIPLRTQEEYQYGWRHAQEATASSLSGVHFGHYIAAIEDIITEKINRLMATIPMLTGISPQRWRHTLNVMLEKVAGNCSVEKLRIIMLFEADFNNNNKWLGRAVMRNAESLDEVAPEQYGSRACKAAGTQCLNKRLFYDYIRAMKIPAALCSNDAKSCYDRIVLLIAALALCCLGAPVTAMESMVATLAQLQHHVRSAYGNSSSAQGQADWKAPVAGIGQGNGAGPQIWAAVSSPLFAILRQEGFVATVICAMSMQYRSMGGFAFVDDTDLIVTDSSNNEQKVAEKMQQSLTLWHGLLKATGGDLVPDKCFWYLIDFQAEGNHWKYKHLEADHHKLQIPKDDRTSVIIPRLNLDEARRTLGVRLAPDGNNDEEFKYLQGVTTVWKNHMITAKIPHAAADFALRQVLLPKLRYPLIATTLTEKQCQAILKPVLQQGLPAMGVN